MSGVSSNAGRHSRCTVMLHASSCAEQGLRHIAAQTVRVQTAVCLGLLLHSPARAHCDVQDTVPGHSSQKSAKSWGSHRSSSLLLSALFEALYGTLPPDPLSATLPTAVH